MDKAILLAIAASLCTATASVCQRLGARSDETAGFDVWLVFRLARRPVWLLGLASMILGFAFQLSALHAYRSIDDSGAGEQRDSRQARGTASSWAQRPPALAPTRRGRDNLYSLSGTIRNRPTALRVGSRPHEPPGSASLSVISPAPGPRAPTRLRRRFPLPSMRAGRHSHPVN
jgi:hypothetical protein